MTGAALVPRTAQACRGCGAGTRKGTFCDDCRPPRAARPSPAKRGYGHRHRRRRVAFLAKHPICMHRDRRGQRDCSAPSTDLDHRIPLAPPWNGPDDESNYEALCGTHHRSKTARQSSGWGSR